MDWSVPFGAVSLIALVAWIALIALPRWPALLAGVLYLGIGLLCLAYVLGLAAVLSGIVPGNEGEWSGFQHHRRGAHDLRQRCGRGDRLDALPRLRPVRRPVDRARWRCEAHLAAGAGADPDRDVPGRAARPARLARAARTRRAPAGSVSLAKPARGWWTPPDFGVTIAARQPKREAPAWQIPRSTHPRHSTIR